MRHLHTSLLNQHLIQQHAPLAVTITVICQLENRFLYQDFYSICSYAKQMPFCEKICIVVSPDMKITIDFQSFCNATPAEQFDCICELCASNIYLLLPKFNLKWEFHFLLFTAHKQSLGQGNIFRSVCQEFCSRGGGGLPQCMLGYPPPGQPPPPTQCMLGDTANKRAVCILLECNLVHHIFPVKLTISTTPTVAKG